MEKIVLVFPSIQESASDLMPPLPLIYIATPLKKTFEIKIIDQRVDKNWRDNLKKELLSDNVVCVGISSMTGPQISGGIEAASIVKKSAHSVPVVWGGIHPSLLPEETINDEFIDIVVIGDGEETFSELVDVLRKGGDKKNVKGIIYKEGKSVVRTASREQFPISKITNPAYDLVDIERYKFSPLGADAKGLPLLTSRGCPFRCSYCYNTEFSQRKWTALSPEQTISSIFELMNRYDIKDIFLLDDNFFVDMKRVRRICELLIENKINVRIFNANCRADTIARMDDDFLRLIKRAGLAQIFVGVESGSDEILSKIKKDVTVEQVLTASRKLKKAGIVPFYSFMAGFPFETIEEIKKTLYLMNRLLRENPQAIVYKLQFYTPFPGTELFHLASKLGMQFPKSLKDWADYHYDRINYNGFSAKHRRFLEASQCYSTFLDKKLRVSHPQYLKLISNLYSKILKFRLDHGFYMSLYELYPIRICQKIRNKLLARTSQVK